MPTFVAMSEVRTATGPVRLVLLSSSRIKVVRAAGAQSVAMRARTFHAVG
jgi:hypothetical protein